MNILLEEVVTAGLGGGSLNALGSSFESDEQPFIFTIGINPTPDFAGKDVVLDPAVEEADRKLTNQNKSLSSPIFGNVPDPPRNSQDAVTERLASLYEDPQFGPLYFRQNARLIKHLLLVYKHCKTNPNLGMFFHRGSKTGIHIHFNSVSKKRQLVIPLGSPNLEPVRVDLGGVKSWYKAQRRKAITARLKAQLELMELKLALSKAKNAMNAASLSLDMVLGRFEGYLDNCLKRENSIEAPTSEAELLRAKEGVENLAVDPRSKEKYIWFSKEIRSMKCELSLKTDELAELHDEQGMYEEKEFLKLMLDGLKEVTSKFVSLSKLITEVYDCLVKCDKQTHKSWIKNGGHNLRSRTIEGKIRKNVEFITNS